MASRTPGDGGRPRLRADAARNRAQILAAARTAFRELGTAAPLDEIARRAGVNIATLYRRFPDREALVQQVVLDGFATVVEAARHALDSAPPDPPAAIEEFLLNLVDARDTLVLPLIGGPLATSPEALELQDRIPPLLDDLLARARSRGSIRPEATHMDLIATAAMVCRPMPYLPADQARALATRHVRIFVDGLRTDGPRTLPPSPTHRDITAHLRTGTEGG
ncbi:TetR/AcrR family transcriptional regulator [Streptomyces sp. NPDC001068]|uniref:TetR/AcrR family transcriptional regulator n=1 Tax=Streptomyces sp. NPDC001068 TaxID=3364544 RepID=UPI00368D2389